VRPLSTRSWLPFLSPINRPDLTVDGFRAGGRCNNARTGSDEPDALTHNRDSFHLI
jgi:hypothetical protein